MSRRREGLGPCAAPFGRPEPQSQLPFLAQRPQAAPGAHGETWGRPLGRAGGAAGCVCVRVGSAAAAPGSPPGGLGGVWTEPKPLSVPRPGGWKRRPPETSRPAPGSRRGGGEGLVAGGARRSREKPSAGPFRAPRPQCRHRHLTFLRTGF